MMFVAVTNYLVILIVMLTKDDKSKGESNRKESSADNSRSNSPKPLPKPRNQTHAEAKTQPDTVSQFSFNKWLQKYLLHSVFAKFRIYTR